MDTVDLEVEARLKKHLLDIQSPEGSWALYPGSEGHLSTTIESYFALKLTGMRAGDEPMAAALDPVQGRHRELRHAGALLPGGDGADNMGSDGCAADRTRAFPELVSVQHLRAQLMGARNADGTDDAAGGASRKKDRLPARSAGTVHPAAAFHEVQTAAREKIGVAAQRAEPRRQGAAILRSAQNQIDPCARAAPRGKLAHRASGGEWLVGRNRAMLPAERDGSESQWLPQRPSGAEEGDRGVARTDLALQRLRHVHAVRVGQLGHGARGPGAAGFGIADRPSGAEAGIAMVYRSSDFQEGRLGSKAARARTGRLGVRVLQRLVSRRGRFGGNSVGDGGFDSR